MPATSNSRDITLTEDALPLRLPDLGPMDTCVIGPSVAATCKIYVIIIKQVTKEYDILVLISHAVLGELNLARLLVPETPSA